MKTLRQAIQAGIEDGVRQIGSTTSKHVPKMADVIEKHVREWLAAVNEQLQTKEYENENQTS